MCRKSAYPAIYFVTQPGAIRYRKQYEIYMLGCRQNVDDITGLGFGERISLFFREI